MKTELQKFSLKIKYKKKKICYKNRTMIEHILIVIHKKKK